MPAIDPVTAVAGAIAEVAVTARPFLEEWLAQRNDNERKERLRDWQTAIRSDNAPGLVPLFVDKLLNDAGAPVGAVGDVWIKIPTDFLDQLVQVAVGKIHDDKQLASMIAALKRK